VLENTAKDLVSGRVLITLWPSKHSSKNLLSRIYDIVIDCAREISLQDEDDVAVDWVEHDDKCTVGPSISISSNEFSMHHGHLVYSNGDSS
jgi:hypothetical protein